MHAHFRPETAVSILEAAYAMERTDDAWLRGLIGAAAPSFDLGLGVCAYFTEVGGPGEIRTSSFVGALHRDVKSFYDEALSRVGPEAMRQLHMLGPFGTTVRMQNPLPGEEVVDKLGAATAAAVMGLDAEGRGVTLATWSPPGRVVPPREGEQRFWGRIAPHLATAARLRRKLASTDHAPEAVLDPSGSVLHAERAARDKLARQALRDAAKRIDRARAAGTTIDDAEALELWRCLVDKQWSFADRFESDGRRYVVAFRNPPSPRVDLSVLTTRERTVAMAAAMGHANKVIAYELDVSVSTVATLLSRCARKLGVTSRVELVHAVRAARPSTEA